MEAGRITDYFGIRTNKRKYSCDGELASAKVAALEADPRTPDSVPSRAAPRSVREPAAARAPEATRARARAVTRLCFDAAPAPAPSLAGIKRTLASSSRLAELKSKISQFNDSYDKFKSNERTPEKALKQFETIDLAVPVSPVKRAFASPIKTLSTSSPLKTPSLLLSPTKSPSKVPAYLRYEHLASTAPKLPLPHHYKFLGEVFRAIETASSMLINRKETVTFAKIKPAAQEMLKRNVTEKHLSQIKKLRPEMYTLSREKLRNFGNASKKEEYELVMIPQISSESGFVAMTPNIKVERQRKFYNSLLDKVKTHHERFMLTLDPPMIVEQDKLNRWHPEFDLEAVPDVDYDPLPAAPNAERFTTAQDMLSKAKDMFYNPRLQKAFENVAKKRFEAQAESKNGGEPPVAADKVSTPPPTAPLNPALKNIPVSLLQKVRARQAERAQREMTMSSSQEENILIYQRLPELARVVQNVFVVEKRCILPVELMLNKLEYSLKFNIPPSKLLEYLKVLAKEQSEWLEFNIVKKVEYVKLDKKIDFGTVISSLEKLANQNS